MIGACLIVRRRVLEDVGGFDPNFFVYGEEIDLQYRVKKAGWRLVYVPSRGILHHGGQSAKQAGVAASLHDYRGRWLFVRKHYPPLSIAAYLMKTLLGLIVWMGYWGTLSVARSTPDAARQSRDYLQLLAWHLGGRGGLAAPPSPGHVWRP